MISTALLPIATSPVDVYPESLRTIIRTLQKNINLTPTKIKDIVLKANVSARDLMPWANFDHSLADSYGRKLVFDGGHFEIMVMSWVPGDFSAIHDHGSTQWGTVQCFGAAAHYIYRFQKGVLTTLRPAHYSPGMALAVDHSLIHQMGNVGDMPFLSLHVYGCANGQGNITGDARIFDLLEGNLQYTDGGAFFCLPEAQINRRGQRLKADEETMFRHHCQMRDRIYRILAVQSHPNLEEKLDWLQAHIQRLGH